MHIFLTIIAFLVIFSFLVLAHEWGHYAAAKRAGIRIDEFGFGMPPRLFAWRKGETFFSLNALPFGGFVKLYGEDPNEPGVLKSDRSFAAKPLRQRILVVLAGVIMNLIMAVLLLFVGFLIGIQPLMVDSADVIQAMQNGDMVTQPGLTVRSVEAGSIGEKIGIRAGDLFVSINGHNVTDQQFLQAALALAKTEKETILIRRQDSLVRVAITPAQVTAETFGLTFFDNFSIPRVVIQSLKMKSELDLAGLRAGDVLLSVNDKPIYSLEDFQSAFVAGREFKIQYARDFHVQQATVTFSGRRFLMVSDVLPGSNAEKSGLKKGDIVVQVQRQDVMTPEDALSFLRAARDASQPAQVLIDRSGVLQTFYISAGSNGMYGVQVSPLLNPASDIVTYSAPLVTTVLELKRVSYPVGTAFLKAFSESYRLAKATLLMFGSLLKDVFSRFEVPSSVAGPVGIAQMTGVYVQEGFWSLLRFMAMLSLSLGILNVLPFPGLDGGRLLFLVIEAITGRSVHQRFEQTVHILGFVVLMVVILLVTYNDIVRAFF